MDTTNLRRLVDLISRLEREANERLGNQPGWSTDRAGYHAYESWSSGRASGRGRSDDEARSHR